MGEICLSLEKSPFQYTTEYNYTYHFATALRMRKFAEKRKQRIDYVAAQFEKVYHVKMDCSLIADLQLYLKIENHGCHIVTDTGVRIKWLDKVVLSGMKPIYNDLTDL